MDKILLSEPEKISIVKYCLEFGSILKALSVFTEKNYPIFYQENYKAGKKAKKLIVPRTTVLRWERIST